jgi:hypothetical protein
VRRVIHADCETGVDLSSILAPFSSSVPQTGLESFVQPLTLQQLEIPEAAPSNFSPWNSAMLQQDGQQSPMFVMEEFSAISSPQSGVSPRASPSSASVVSNSPDVKLEPSATKTPSPIRKVKAGGRVEKKRSPPASSSASSLSSSAGSSKAGQFLIVTPNSISASAGKHNLFECFEALGGRPSHKGRKGPLANSTKENALQVRRLGACFCCHARKVKVSGTGTSCGRAQRK